jgi:hypothetical protein
MRRKNSGKAHHIGQLALRSTQGEPQSYLRAQRDRTELRGESDTLQRHPSRFCRNFSAETGKMFSNDVFFRDFRQISGSDLAALASASLPTCV